MMAQRAPEARYEPLPRFPSVTRDIAVVCDAAVTVAQLEECISKGAKGLLKEVELFDIYTGAPIPAGKKSVAFNLVLRADDRSLTAAEADEDVKSVLGLSWRASWAPSCADFPSLGAPLCGARALARPSVLPWQNLDHGRIHSAQ